jgi:hypothetical protein
MGLPFPVSTSKKSTCCLPRQFKVAALANCEFYLPVNAARAVDYEGKVYVVKGNGTEEEFSEERLSPGITLKA